MECYSKTRKRVKKIVLSTSNEPFLRLKGAMFLYSFLKSPILLFYGFLRKKKYNFLINFFINHFILNALKSMF
ncbi:hypothetical protein HCD_03395 [Helicobacter cetorum MIT 99-5656]|uniref:Uncharacterized protein n=1 Tax=Helicobacter cetorum (strain ATCC BAA-540 / CCUG 52418 / MIT 99-5656) TaxID=1163745 RepID=I0ERX6_HELCM|nr:hypothetical protein HCD_03395 [Helicobacter cetorum MIT 99-5656]